MALFKILSNMISNSPPAPYSTTDTGIAVYRTASAGLPNTYHQGFCYFDITTGKFWIDTAADTANNADKEKGRIAINAYKADKATLAQTAMYETTPDENDTEIRLIHDTYVKRAGDTMNGALMFPSQSSAYNDKNILFSSGAHIGSNTNGDIGIYARDIYLRTGSHTTNNGYGLYLSSTAVKAHTATTVQLGEENIPWKTVYSKGFISNNLTDSANSSGFVVETAGEIQGYFQNRNIGSSSSQGYTSLSLGNNKTSTQDLNSRGELMIYGKESAKHTIYSAITGSDNRIIYFQNYAGDQYLIHGASSAAIGDTNTPVYVAANGRITTTGKSFADYLTINSASSTYVHQAGDTMTGNLTMSGTNTTPAHVVLGSGKNSWIKYGSNASDYIIGHNETNVWINGYSTSVGQSNSQVFIGTGYNSTTAAGYNSIYVAVPNDTNTGANYYSVLHTGENTSTVKTTLSGYLEVPRLYFSGGTSTKFITTSSNDNDGEDISVQVNGAYPLVIAKEVVRRGASYPNTTLGSSTYPWAAAYATTFIGALSGTASNAIEAYKFSSTRKIELTGDVTGSDTKNGSSGWSIAATLKTVNSNTGSWGQNSDTTIPDGGGSFSVPYITVNGKGLTTAAANKTITIPSVDRVKITNSTVNGWKKILLHPSYNAARSPDTTISGTTNVIHESQHVEVNPSTGTVRAYGFYATTAVNTRGLTSNNTSTDAAGSGLFIQANSKLQAYIQNGTVGTNTTQGYTTFSLGNNIPTGTADNSRGQIIFYNNTGRHVLYSNAADSASYSVFIQGYSGNQYLTHAGSTTAVGDANTPVYVGSNGRVITTGKSFADYLTINSASSTYVRKAGDTMTGNLTISKSAPEIRVLDTSSSATVSVLVGSGHINHGLYSYGYSPTTTSFTSDAKWMIYRDKNGAIYLNGIADRATNDAAGNSITATYVHKAGDTMTGTLTIQKSSNPYLMFRNTTMNIATTLTAAAYNSIYFADKNDLYNAYIQASEQTSGNSNLYITARTRNTDNTANVNAQLTLTAQKDGDKFAEFNTEVIGSYDRGYAFNFTSTTTVGVLKVAPADFSAQKFLQLTSNGYLHGSITNTRSSTTAGTVGLILGNARYSGQDYNARGQLTLYSSNTANTSLTGAYGALGGTNRNYISTGYFSGTQLWGAVYNDYAEFRETKEKIEPGKCVIEQGDGSLELSTERLMRGGEIVSDTYGFAIGETEKAKTPIAASGRVLAYCYEGQEYAKDYIGWPVGTGPNGTVSIMTEEEEKLYPSRIIGTISEIPNYDNWQCGSKDEPEYVKVNGRIWIRIR